MTLKRLALLLLATMTIGCTPRYHKYDINSYYYGYKHNADDSLRVGFFLNIQSNSKNNKYWLREGKAEKTLIAVEIENQYNHSVFLTPENFIPFSGDKQLTTYSSDAYLAKVHQNVGTHLLHSFWGPTIFYTESENGTTTKRQLYHIPIGWTLGIPKAIKASLANRQNSLLVEKNSVWGKEIKPGEILRGTLVIPFVQDTKLRFVYTGG